MSIYIYIHNDFDACNEFCIVLLYILPYVHIRIYIYMYIIYIYKYIYIYTHYLTNLLFFHNSLCFSINTYLILNIHECILK